MDSISDLIIYDHLFCVIDTGGVVDTANRVGNKRRFGNKQRALHGRALGVIGYYYVGWDMGVGGVVARHGRHSDAVLEVNIAQPKGG